MSDNDRAALPDRVEAARTHIDERLASLQRLHDTTAHFDTRVATALAIQELVGVRVLLAAADACEAERNANTTNDGRYAYLCEVCNDQPWWRIERADAVVTWACSEHLSTACLRLVRVGYRDALTITEATPVVDSRPVSSEDVHREQET